MKIETLLRAYGICCLDMGRTLHTNLCILKDIHKKRDRQREAIRKGIIRKFERLEADLSYELTDKAYEKLDIWGLKTKVKIIFDLEYIDDVHEFLNQKVLEKTGKEWGLLLAEELCKNGGY